MRDRDLSCFKAYDIRGRVPDELDEELAEAIGRAYAAETQPRGPVAVGYDIRLSSTALAAALIRGLNGAGIDTCDIGLCGTEMVYFAAAQPGLGGGIMVTASHNPAEYNGMKFVRGSAVPISGDTGLEGMRARIGSGRWRQPAASGRNTRRDVTEPYTAALLSMVNREALKPLRVVVNAGNGGAGPVVDALAPALPFEMIRLHHDPDGTFPHGVPNPLLPENRGATSDAVRAHGADFGVAWDGDFDRCFFFDGNGDFVEGYYIVGLLAEQRLRRCPGARIVHDPRLTWNTIDVVTRAGGVPLQHKTGHAFMKERMRREDALYGGEMSAHHYFREFAYCDSGMIPWLLLAELLSGDGPGLSERVAERMRLFPCSGEINRGGLPDPAAVVSRVRSIYESRASHVDETDGISMEFGEGWRFNLRQSNTEPLVRLNVEARGNRDLMEQRTREILALIDRDR
ncbi:MAG: phosphomannomutase [Lentisphaeria bacterium]|nr:phosphomannomutase [Lentisphaeria bacterium]